MDEARIEACLSCSGCMLTDVPVGSRIPYEIHVTVAEADVSAFRETCRSLGVKALLLDLHLRRGGTARDVMTSSIHAGDDVSVDHEADRIRSGLQAAGFYVVRTKVETAPWHPAARIRAGRRGGYFESHLAVSCPDGRLPELVALSSRLGLHLSRNAMKIGVNGGPDIVMATLRVRDGDGDGFAARVDELRAAIEVQGFEIAKSVIEYALVDTKEGLDDRWLEAA